MLLDVIWEPAGRPRPGTDGQRGLLWEASAEQLESMLASHYSPEAHGQLLSWVLETTGGVLCEKGESSERLRVTIAEVFQIVVWGAEDLLEPDVNQGRQSQAYVNLLRIVTCRPFVRCWA
uniref:Uncharacterized protein n=2 Tax=Alexandrium monilatum TaxID=311494 RepID=A0A7S4UVE2_9DINO